MVERDVSPAPEEVSARVRSSRLGEGSAGEGIVFSRRENASFRGISAAAAPFILAIQLYRAGMRGLLPSSCRFFPSCSGYAETALRRWGLVSGTLLTLRRLLRCHPWHPGGFDPPPAQGQRNR